ncbi:MAG TPA: arylamine N-acetyltransferase [Planctomycetaceae bacterium]|jgi:N-hydroxyarylamine O-acetyltransferase
MPIADGTHIDLDAYFARIEYRGGREPTIRMLSDLHLAHATHVPFENLDVMLRRPIRIDLGSVQAKLVQNRRGGYCFEQNLLFAAALEQLGFSVTLLQARVRFGTQRVIPRTHVTLAVDIGGERWLADLGFGSYGLLLPIPLASGEYQQFAWPYRLGREADLWVLQAPVGGVWQDLYVFNLEPQLAVDFEAPNHYVSTHPDSRFVQTLTVQRVSQAKRLVLRNTELTTTTPAGDMRQTIAGDAELLNVLAEHFDLHFPTGTMLLSTRH